MKRRQLLTGLGAVTAGGAVLGTGAFSSVQTDRSVSVSVANEDQAYLGISPTTGNNATFTRQDSGTNNKISFDIDDASGTHDDGEGVGLNSVYEFDNVFQIENQGTQEVEVSIGELKDTDFDPNVSGLTIQFYPGSNAGSPLHTNPVTIGTGNSQNIGIKIKTIDPAVNEFDADATVNADAT